MKRARLLKLVGSGALLVGAAFAGQKMWPRIEVHFVLEDLRIISESPDVEARVRSLIKGYLGESLFSMNLNELRSQLLRIPRIESVELHRRWPDTLVVQVVERAAVALGYQGDKLALLDREGQFIEELHAPKGLPLVLDPVQAMPIQDICKWLYSIQIAGEPELLSYSKIDEIHWSPDAGLKIKSASLGLTVELGYRDFGKKWEQAQKAYFFSYQKGRIARHIDADNLRRVILSGEELAHSTPESGPLPTPAVF